MATIVNSLGNATELAGSVTAHPDHTLISELMLPINSTPAVATGGVGPAIMAQLIYSLNGVAAANNASILLNGLNDPLSYGVGTPACTATAISKKETLVRMLVQNTTDGGFVYCVTGTSYPGLGPTHVANMANLATATSIQDMATLMNAPTTDVAEVVPMAGCTDKAGDTSGDGDFTVADTPYNTYNPGGTYTGEGDIVQPDFKTPCQADEPNPGSLWK